MIARDNAQRRRRINVQSLSQISSLPIYNFDRVQTYGNHVLQWTKDDFRWRLVPHHTVLPPSDSRASHRLSKRINDFGHAIESTKEVAIQMYSIRR
jgi:Leu/Phe-tRNA-protein transferase